MSIILSPNNLLFGNKPKRLYFFLTIVLLILFSPISCYSTAEEKIIVKGFHLNMTFREVENNISKHEEIFGDFILDSHTDKKIIFRMQGSQYTLNSLQEAAIFEFDNNDSLTYIYLSDIVMKNFFKLPRDIFNELEKFSRYFAKLHNIPQLEYLEYFDSDKHFKKRMYQYISSSGSSLRLYTIECFRLVRIQGKTRKSGLFIEMRS